MQDSWWNEVYRPAHDAADLRPLLRQLGIEIRHDGKAVRNPLREERTPSFHVFEDHWHDFGSGEHGDLVDYLVATGLTKEHAMEEAAVLLNIPGPSKAKHPTTSHRRTARPAPRTNEVERATRAPARRSPATVAQSPETGAPAWLDELVAKAAQALQDSNSDIAENARIYARERGLWSVARHLSFGVIDGSVQLPQVGRELERLHGRLLIPTFERGSVVGLTARAINGEGEPKYLKLAGVPVSAPWNADAIQVAPKVGHLLLTEGELDAASLLAAFGVDFPALGLSGGSLPAGWLERLVATRSTIYILADGDATGRQKAEALQAKLVGVGARARIAQLHGHKDANEALQAIGPEGLSSAVSDALAAAETAASEAYNDSTYIRTGFLAEIEARANRPHPGYSTGLSKVDALLEGGFNEGLHLIGGITGGGKTSLALNIALHNAEAGRPVLYATYEQSRLELWARIAARLTGVPYGAIKRGVYEIRGERLSAADELRASEGWGRLEGLSQYLKVVEAGDALSRSESTYTIDTLATTARAITDASGAPPLVIIDYLQRMPGHPEIRDVRERVGHVAGALQVRLGRDIGCPVLALSSIGRASYNQEAFARLPTEERLAAFKESGEAEYTAYSATVLYRLPEAKQGRQFLPGLLEEAFRPMTLEVVKNREGRTGRFAIKWLPQKDTWYEAVDYGSDDTSL